MAKDCIRTCPRIRAILGSMSGDNFLAGIGPFHPALFSDDDSGAGNLLAACEASYDCNGPSTGTVMKERGIFRVRVETETQAICGLTG